eukprot:gene56701-77716_t
MSGKKKGLSVDEKKKVLLAIYHEKKEPFNLKEIENHGSKKGVVQQTIKDINQALIDDGLVLGDKIGSANFFWSFPSKYYQDQLNLKDRTTQTTLKTVDSIGTLKSQISECRTERNMIGREEMLQQLAGLQEEEKKLDAELDVLKFNDPAEIKGHKAMAMKVKDAADRWTDNIWTIKSYLTKKKGMA